MSSSGNGAPGQCTVLDFPGGERERVGVECSGYIRCLILT